MKQILSKLLHFIPQFLRRMTRLFLSIFLNKKNKTMIHKTDTIKNNHKASGHLENWLEQQMPQLLQLNKLNAYTVDLQQTQPQFEFVNLKDLSVDAFLRLQQMENPAYSIVFVNQIISKPRHVKLKIDGVTKHIPFEKIIRLEACSNYTQFYLSNTSKTVLTSKTLKYYVEQLSKDAFVRPHQSHLVNLNYIEEVVLKPKPHLVLKEGGKINISRRKVSTFRNLGPFQ